MKHEWDWQPDPPLRRRPSVVYEGPRRQTRISRAHPRVTKAVNVYWSAVKAVLVVAVSVPLALALVGAIWLLSKALSGF